MPRRCAIILAALFALALIPSTAMAAPKKTFVRFSSTAYSVPENVNGGTFNLTLVRSGNTSSTAAVTVTATGGTATSPANYTLPAPTVTFNPRETTKTVPVTITDDSVFTAPNKTVQFSISGGGTQFKGGPATLTILENDGPGTIDFTALNYNVVESAGVATVTVGRNSATNLSESVDYTTVARPAAAGNATAGVDYLTSSGTITFAPNEMTKTFQVPVLDDSSSEGNELINLSLSNPKTLPTGTAPNLGPNAKASTLTILDDDSTFSFSSKLYTVAEDVAAGEAAITVNRGGVTTVPASVYYSTSDGSAKAGSDYTDTHGTLAFAAGETSKTFRVPIANDGAIESTETINLSLAASAATGAPVFDTSTVNILDNDNPQPSVQLTDVAYGATEPSNGTATVDVTVTLSHAVDGDVTVPVSTSDVAADNTATAGDDYTPLTDTIVFKGRLNDPQGVGETSKTVHITVLGDTEVEGDEVFQVNLGSPTGASLGTPNSAPVTITDDDLPGNFEFSSLRYDAAESDGQATITVSRVGGASGPASVDYFTADGSASTPGDYSTASGTLQFADGETQKTFDVPVVWDGQLEGDETVNLELANPSAGSDLGTKAASVLHIGDDGASAPVQFDAPGYSVSEADGLVTVTVVRSGAKLGGPVTVDYATSDGSATAGSDYMATHGTLTFAAGETTKTFQVPVTDDKAYEGAETIGLTLSNPGGGTSVGSPATAVVTVNDDDPAPVIDPGTSPGGSTGSTGATGAAGAAGATGASGVAGAAGNPAAGPDPVVTLTPARDKRAPKLTLSAKKVQKALKTKLFLLTAKCDENCNLSVVAKVGKGHKVITLGKRATKAKAGKKVNVKVKLTKKSLAQLTKALKRGKAKVTITVVAADAARNATKASRVVTARV
jgi:hypothetical protein